MAQYFLMPQYFHSKQADNECILNKVSKNHCLKKSRPGGGEWVGFSYLIFIYTWRAGRVIWDLKGY